MALSALSDNGSLQNKPMSLAGLIIITQPLEPRHARTKRRAVSLNKKIMRATLLFILLITITTGRAQLINGTFESVNTTTFNDPQGWFGGNEWDLHNMNFNSVTKVPGITGFAVRIETKVAGSSVSESFIINTEPPCGDPPNWTGGVPFTQMPTALTGKFRYSLPGNDTALILVIFLKNGAHVGDNLIKIKGSGSQPTFTSFSYPMTVTTTPDSMIFAATSSNKITGMYNENGSFLELEDLAFTGATQTIANGNFDSWTVVSKTYPAGWQSFNYAQNVVSSGSHTGSYAVRMETEIDNCGNISPGGLTNGIISESSGPKGGQPYTLMTDTLCGFYKYIPSGSDAGSVYVTLTNNSNSVGGGYFQFTSASSYTYFEVPVSAYTSPDTMRIDFQSSEWPVNASDIGSVLFIDDVYMKSMPLSIADYENFSGQIHLFPNPVQGNLSLSFSGSAREQNNYISIYNALSELVYSVNFRGELFNWNANAFAPGIYYVEIKNEKGFAMKKFVKQ